MTNLNTLFYLTGGIACLIAHSVSAATPVPPHAEMAQARRWVAENLKPVKQATTPLAANPMQ